MINMIKTVIIVYINVRLFAFIKTMSWLLLLRCEWHLYVFTIFIYREILTKLLYVQYDYNNKVMVWYKVNVLLRLELLFYIRGSKSVHENWYKRWLKKNNVMSCSVDWLAIGYNVPTHELLFILCFDMHVIYIQLS